MCLHRAHPCTRRHTLPRVHTRSWDIQTFFNKSLQPPVICRTSQVASCLLCKVLEGCFCAGRVQAVALRAHIFSLQ